jgi:hypothetical protein
VGKRANQTIYWAPRILSILFLLFLALFSLDVLDMNLGFWGTIVGLFMHNIPAFILLIILIVSWKREIVGGVVFILAGIAYIVGILKTILENSPHQWYMLTWSLIIAGPAFLIGILFIVGWYRKKKELKRNSTR